MKFLWTMMKKRKNTIVEAQENIAIIQEFKDEQHGNISIAQPTSQLGALSETVFAKDGLSQIKEEDTSSTIFDFTEDQHNAEFQPVQKQPNAKPQYKK